jgi:hypothetical protein
LTKNVLGTEKCTRTLKVSFQCCGSFWCRSRSKSDLMPIRIRIGINTMPIHMWILSHVWHMLQNQNFVLLLVTAFPVYNILSFISFDSAVIFCIFDRISESPGKKFCSSTFSFAWNYRSGSTTLPVSIAGQCRTNPWPAVPYRPVRYRNKGTPARYRYATVPDRDSGCRNTDAGGIGFDADAQLSLYRSNCNAIFLCSIVVFSDAGAACQQNWRVSGEFFSTINFSSFFA